MKDDNIFKPYKYNTICIFALRLQKGFKHERTSCIQYDQAL